MSGERTSLGSRAAAVLLVLLVGVLGFLAYALTRRPEPRTVGVALRVDVDTASALVQRVAAIIGAMAEAPAFSNLVVEPGLRGEDGEVAGPGEVKVMVNLDWEALPGGRSLADAIDVATARLVEALMEGEPNLFKLRVIVKVEKRWLKRWTEVGPAQGHDSIAKLYSLTRVAYDAVRARDPRARADIDPLALLAAGDYVVRSDAGWTAPSLAAESAGHRP